MFVHDPAANLSYFTILPNQAITGAVTSTAFPLFGTTGQLAFQGKVALVLSPGVGSGTNQAVTVTVTTGPTTSSGAAVAFSPALTATTTPGATGPIVISVDPRAANKYLFVTTAIAGTSTPTVPLSVTLVGTTQTEG